MYPLKGHKEGVLQSCDAVGEEDSAGWAMRKKEKMVSKWDTDSAHPKDLSSAHRDKYHAWKCIFKELFYKLYLWVGDNSFLTITNSELSTVGNNTSGVQEKNLHPSPILVNQFNLFNQFAVVTLVKSIPAWLWLAEAVGVDLNTQQVGENVSCLGLVSIK